MNDIALVTARDVPAATIAPVNSINKPLRNGAIAGGVALFAALAWHVRHDGLFTSGSTVGYALGVAGASLMLSLLLYPLRKRVHCMQGWGPLKHWFKIHMIAGVAGPVLVLFHSTFRVGSLNAAVALGCMLLVAASGLVGRFLYRKIHHGLYGSQATLAELQRALDRQLTSLAPRLNRMAAVRGEVERFAALAAQKPADWRNRTACFITLGWKRFHAQRRIRRGIAVLARPDRRGCNPSREQFADLLRTVDATLCAAQRTAQFATYERLFSLWHFVHIPFLVMLVVTAIIHAVAVHVY